MIRRFFFFQLGTAREQVAWRRRARRRVRRARQAQQLRLRHLCTAEASTAALATSLQAATQAGQ